MGPAGAEGPQGPQGPGIEPTDTPVGIPTALWSPAPIEDRRVTPPAIIGSLQLVRDDIDQYFVAIEADFARPIAGDIEVYQAVAGADLTTQMGFDETERPQLVTTLSADGAQFIRLEGAPPQATGGNQRFFDWIVLWDPNSNENVAVADMDALNDIPDGIPTVVWNAFELQDRRTDPATAGFGSAVLIRDDRDTYFVMLSDDFVRPDGADADIYGAVAGAELATQIADNDPTEQPFQIGTITDDGEQFVRLDSAPPRATGGNQRFFDWILLHNGTENVAVADLDALNQIER